MRIWKKDETGSIDVLEIDRAVYNPDEQCLYFYAVSDTRQVIERNISAKDAEHALRYLFETGHLDLNADEMARRFRDANRAAAPETITKKRGIKRFFQR